MDDPEKLKLRDLLGHFTTKQLWAAAGALVGLVVASFGAGVWLASQKHALDLAHMTQAKDESIRKVTSEVESAAAAHRAKVTELEKQFADAKASADAVSAERAWLKLKAEYLEHHLRYELAMSDGEEDIKRARALFVGFVHRLWKTQEDNAVRVAMGTVNVRSDLPLVARPVVGPTVQKPTTVQRFTTVQRRVIKTVTFPDKSSYVVPYEIASEVHRRE
jgi:hypothetical protein